jgi:hypothetical protein
MVSGTAHPIADPVSLALNYPAVERAGSSFWQLEDYASMWLPPKQLVI